MDHVGAGTFTKPLLVELSHTIERLALAARGGPLVLVAMFQRQAYFQREAEVYAALAARGVVTVVGVVEDDLPGHLPTGVCHVRLNAEDDLVKEWSVTVLGPRGGATLVAADLEALAPGSPTLEQGRTFRAGWSFRRAEARQQVERLRARLPLDPGTAADVDAVLRAVAAAPEPADEVAWDEALQFLAGRVDVALRAREVSTAALNAALESGERDPHTGFHGEAFLTRWFSDSPGGTLPMGLVLLQLSGLAAIRTQYGRRAELAVLKGLAEGLRALTRDVDRVVTLGREDILVLLPSAGPDDVLRVCNEACRVVSNLDDAYPFAALPAKVAGTVTRERPLPIDRLRRHAGTGQRAELVPL